MSQSPDPFLLAAPETARTEPPTPGTTPPPPVTSGSQNPAGDAPHDGALLTDALLSLNPSPVTASPAAVELPAAPPPPTSTPARFVPGGPGAPCGAHPTNLAATACERCGNFMCSLCVTPVEGHSYCPRCFGLMHSRGSLGFVQRRFTAPGTCLALGILSIPGLCMGLYSPILAIAALVVGFRAQKQLARQPDLPGRKLVTWGISLGGVSLVASLGFVTWLIIQMTKG